MANSYDVTRLPIQQQPKTTVVNWNSCTADEILSYEEDGQEVPEQYLKWAEEMAAAMNVQDDVTYEMANGEVNEEAGGGNAAQNFRAELGDSGVSLKQQGEIFITESRDKEEQTLASIENMAPLLSQTQEINEEADQVAEETKTRLQEISDQINSQISDKDNFKTKIFGSREDKGELKGLQAVAGALANAASAQLEGLNENLTEIQGTVNEGAAISQLSQDYGTETIAVGNELLGNKGGIAGVMQDIGDFFGGLFGGGGKRKVGREAVQQGAETNTVGQQGAQIAQEAADAAMEAAETAQAGADGSVKSITAADASITVNSSTATAPTIKVAISADEGNALSLEDDGLKVTIGAAPEYSMVKAETATAGYAATYHLTKNGANTGAAIDIPKDYLVKSATLKESTGEGDPSGLPAGTKYIDFVVNTADTTGTESHIYLNVNDLVDVYTAGNGIEISGENEVSAKVVTGNGLSVSEAGIAMGAASADAAGAMSSADFSKLQGIAAGAEVNYVKSVSAPFSVSGAGALSASEATASASGLMSAADKAHLDAIVAGGEGYITSVTAPLDVSEEGELSIGAASGSAAGTMSSADFTKLAGVADGAEVNVIDAITFNGSAVNVAGKTAAITLEWTDLA